MTNISSFNRKIRVFVSSICRNKELPRYDGIRKKLKERIESTGIAEVYLFEMSPASSTPVGEDYIGDLVDSDVVIFLIDNKDGVTEGVAREIKGAKARDKKAIYIFCNECESEYTDVQHDLIAGSKVPHYKTVNLFSEFEEAAFEGLISDIVKVYKHYCDDRLDFGKGELEETNISEVQNIAVESLDKSICSDLDVTKSFLSTKIHPRINTVENGSEFDKSCRDFMQVVLGEKTVREFNTSLLLRELKKRQSSELHEIVILRWEAIEHYFLGDLEKCLNSLSEAYNKCLEMCAPMWLQKDILIDMRNMESESAAIKNSFAFETESQRKIDENNEMLFYPLIDRISSLFYKKIDNETAVQALMNPDSTRSSRELTELTDFLTEIYAISLFNGSLTHILTSKGKMQDIYFYCCEAYSSWDFKLGLLRSLIIYDSKTKIDDVLTKYNDILGKLTEKDAKDLFDSTKAIPISVKQFNAKLVVLEHFGYFFSDADYNEIEKSIKSEISIWISNENRHINTGVQIFKMLRENLLRFDLISTIDFCIKTMSFNVPFYNREIFKVLLYADLDALCSKKYKELVKSIIEVVIKNEGQNEEHIDNEFKILILNRFCDFNKVDSGLEEQIKRVLPNLYEEGIMDKNIRDDATGYVIEMLSRIEKFNEKQGSKGMYSFGQTYFTELCRFYISNCSKIDSKSTSKMVSVSINTLRQRNHFLMYKVEASKLLLVLSGSSNENDESLKMFVDEVDTNGSSIYLGMPTMFEKDSLTKLKMNLFLLKVVMKDLSALEVIYWLSKTTDVSESAKKSFMKSLEEIMSVDFVAKLDPDIRNAFFQFVLSECNSKIHSVRMNALSVLISMATEENEIIVVQQLSRVLDFDSPGIKIMINQNFDRLTELYGSRIDFLKQKIAIDNNYVVRIRCKQSPE